VMRRCRDHEMTRNGLAVTKRHERLGLKLAKLW
jgi:hypothetical protein